MMVTLYSLAVLVWLLVAVGGMLLSTRFLFQLESFAGIEAQSIVMLAFVWLFWPPVFLILLVILLLIAADVLIVPEPDQ